MKKSNVQKLYEISFYFLPISLLLREHWGSKAIILFVFLGLIASVKLLKESLFKLLKIRWYIFNLIHLFLGMLSLFYSSNWQAGIGRLSFSLLFVLFPIFQLTLFKKLGTNRISLKMLRFFSIAIYCYCILILIKLLSILMLTDSTLLDIKRSYGYLNFNNIYEYTEINSMYFSMLLCFALFVILDSTSKFLSGWSRIVSHIVTILVTLIMLILIDSKVAYLAFILILILFLYTRNISRNIKILSIGLFLGLIISTLVITPPNRIRRFIEAGDTTRVNNYVSSVEVIKNNYLFGVGYGDELDELQKTRKLADKVDNYIIKMEYNAHNQFFETIIGIGFIGFTPIFVLIIFSVMSALKNKDVLFQSFLIVMCLFFTVESVLVRHYGFLFCSFIWSVFLTYNIGNSQKVIDDKRSIFNRLQITNIFRSR
ncbi:O-antigen ligase [Aquimarina intermedia]|uniref:O-antigen ligase n=1 Tax=Aquimarina intermedia TaxID=350814 RepID=A0A5S5CEU7_9FLAO|nr:O-antigen ligase [Aquimarina intermedia]